MPAKQLNSVALASSGLDLDTAMAPQTPLQHDAASKSDPDTPHFVQIIGRKKQQ